MPYKILLVLVLGLAALILLISKQPLTDVHWDSPIYLSQAKQFADTAYLQSYATHAPEIAKQVSTKSWPRDEFYSEAFWHFSRLGNIVLLGSVVTAFGATKSAIQMSTGLYIILTVLSVAMSALIAMTLIEILGSSLRKTVVGYAAAFSAMLYMTSDMFAYLAGNLVSEVPALFLFSTAAWFLLKSLQKRSLHLAFASGGLAFLLYVFRMESLWNYVAFVLALVLILLWRARQQFWLAGFAAAAFSALMFYGLYAWAFYPLADPDIFLKFTFSQKNPYQSGVGPAADLIIGGGALWVGWLLALRLLRKASAAQFSLIWLGLTILPWMPAIVSGLPTQARMMAFVLPPLFLASTLGWAMLLQTWREHRVIAPVFIAMAMLTVVISNPLSYRVASSLPGMWRLQYARTLVGVTGHEKQTYVVNALGTLSHEIYAGHTPAIVVWNKLQIRREDLNVVRYFGPGYPHDADLALRQDPANPGPCDQKRPVPGIEPVVFCTELTDGLFPGAKAAGIHLLRLQALPTEQPRRGHANFQLTELPT